MVILLFGPPGCGKGTQGAVITQALRVPSISTGEIFRAELKAATPLGNAAKEIMASGGLVGDDIVNGMVSGRLRQSDCQSGFLLDGYPRTIAQAQFLDGLLSELGSPEPIIVYLHVPDEVLVARLTSRRQCPSCGRIYNLLSQPPSREGVCDADGAALIQRDDDKETVIRARLKAYAEQTGPLIEFYSKRNFRRVDGNRPPETIREDIEAILRTS
ncbi:MAG TPA: adenylate kinase [Bryobacteraceae bacterium]|nr:adenylate kinase [Bryobacteraceae bacterium]